MKGDTGQTKRNYRKSYGLEFIEIRKEIGRELKTIEEKIKFQNSRLDAVNRDDTLARIRRKTAS